MISASQLLYEAIGSPAVADVVEHDPGPCWLCGGESRIGQVAEEWVGDCFSDRYRCAAPLAVHVCRACVYVCARTTPVPGRPAKEGKTFGASFRNVSHLLDADGYTNASKGEKPTILSWLRREHSGAWFAAIADSGQIHTIPFCPVNSVGTRRGIVLFERAIVRLPVPYSVGWELVGRMTDLLTAGATKEEIERGDYTPRAWKLCGDKLAAFEEHWAGKRGSPWFSLAIWLAQRDEEAVAARIEAEKEAKTNGKARRKAKGKTAHVDSGVAAAVAETIPVHASEERPQELGHTDIKDKVSNQDDHKPRGVVHGNAPRAEDRNAKQGQLKLFS